MLFQGREGHKVRIVTAYQPVIQKATMIGLVYQQHWQQYIEEGFGLKSIRVWNLETTWSGNSENGDAIMNDWFSL